MARGSADRSPPRSGGRAGLGEWPRTLRRAAWASPLYSLALGRSAPRDLRLVPADPWPGDADRGQALIAGHYSFAGTTSEGEEPLWLPLGAEPEYVAALHSFEWLRDLRAVGGDGARRHARRLVDAWIARHDRWHPLAWRADVLGTRIATWLGTHDFFCASADDAFQDRVFAALARQLRHLMRDAPGEAEGVGRIAALKGLAFGLLAVPGAEHRLPRALDLLAREVDRQILPDGGHVSRDPAALMTALRHLAELRTALRAARVDMPEGLQHGIDRMAPALRFFRHGDGALALFHGGGEGGALMVDTVLTQADARGRPLKSARHSGFERLLAGRTLVVMDVGVPPRGVADQAHASPLAFELSSGRERMIVNCGPWPGPFSGKEGASWRSALRGTPAHSTLTLSDTDAVPIDAGPVPAAVPGPVRPPVILKSDRREEDGATAVEAWHDGYVPAFGLVHGRRLALAAAGDSLTGEDVLTLPEDGPGHRGGMRFAVRFHLHPACQVSLTGAEDSALIRLAGGTGWWFDAEGAPLTVEESLYFGTGERRRTRQLVISGVTDPEGLHLTWRLRRDRRE
ncbi:MAG: heparinase II/III family protein [Azospirillaceae bacterium]